jgi:colanic acid/amylovoran biosynthesis glycosyltransferase
MRVGFVVGQFPMLSETFVISQMAGLLKRGFEVGVVCNGVSDYRYPDKNKEPLSRLLPRTRDWWGPLAGLRQPIDRLPLRLKDKVSTALDTLSVSRLNDFDVLVAHFGHNGARVARLKKRREIGAPLVTIFHGYDVGVPLHDGRLQGYQDLFTLGALSLTVNTFFRDILIKAGATPQKVAVHRMGINASLIPYEWRSRQNGPLQLISVCRLIEKKGVEFTLRALGRIKDRGFDWHYTIVGDGPLRQALEHLAHELGIATRVTFLGSLAHEDVKLWLRQSHVFVLPSVTASNGDVEGVPVALMEAMASGLTVVSSYHSGIPELVDNGHTGFLAAERDVDGLADRICWIMEHPVECEAIALDARRKVEQEFNDELLNDHFANLISGISTRSST